MYKTKLAFCCVCALMRSDLVYDNSQYIIPTIKTAVIRAVLSFCNFTEKTHHAVFQREGALVTYCSPSMKCAFFTFPRLMVLKLRYISRFVTFYKTNNLLKMNI